MLLCLSHARPAAARILITPPFVACLLVWCLHSCLMLLCLSEAALLVSRSAGGGSGFNYSALHCLSSCLVLLFWSGACLLVWCYSSCLCMVLSWVDFVWCCRGLILYGESKQPLMSDFLASAARILITLLFVACLLDWCLHSCLMLLCLSDAALLVSRSAGGGSGF